MAQQLKIFIVRQLLWISVLIFLISMLALVWSAIGIYQAYDYNRHLLNQSISQQNSRHALLLNAAIYSNRGQDTEALNTYAQLVAKGDPEFAKAAWFNSGNHYLRKATEILEQETLMGWDGAGPLLALAKNSYQRALNIDPKWSEAKYNFELALRLSPANHGRKGRVEYERDEDKVDKQPDGWPSIPGSPRGMP